MTFLTKLQILADEPKGVLSIFKGINSYNYYHCLFVKRFFPSIKTFIDVGADIGGYTEAMIDLFPSIQVYAFEPIMESYKDIKKLSNVKAFRLALWRENCILPFYENLDDVRNSSFRENPKWTSNKSTKRIEVIGRRFDDLNIRIEKPCHVKIDVECSEVEVLEGFGRRLWEVDILRLKWMFGMIDISKAISILFNAGFKSFVQKSVRYKNGKPFCCDLFFFREDINGRS